MTGVLFLWIVAFILGGSIAWYLPFFWYGLVINLISFILIWFSYRKSQLESNEGGAILFFKWVVPFFIIVFSYWIIFVIHWCINHLQIA